MSSNNSDYNPGELTNYIDPPFLLHFQWEGKRYGYTVFRYALVEEINHNHINHRSKRKDSERGKTHEEIRDGYLKEH